MSDNEDLLKSIGAKLKEIRVNQDVKQKDLAEKSGLSMFSVSMMETGHNTSLLSLIQYLRALDRLDLLDPFFKEREISEEMLRQFMLEHPAKKRVSSKKLNNYDTAKEEEGPVNRMAADGTEIEFNV